MIVGTAVSTNLVGTILAIAVVLTTLAGTAVPTTFAGTAVPTSLVGTTNAGTVVLETFVVTRFYTRSSEEIFVGLSPYARYNYSPPCLQIMLQVLMVFYTLSFLEAIGSIVYMDTNYVPTRHLN